MEFKIPFTSGNLESLKKKTTKLKYKIRPKKDTALQRYLTNLDVPMTREEYLAVCLKSAITTFIFAYIISSFLLFLVRVQFFYLLSLFLAFLFVGFIYLSQVNYPKLYNSRKQKEIERNLIPALQDMLVQLNSGIPLFNIIVNISSSGYSLLSEEFAKAARKINTGVPQIEVLEEMGERNSSVFFRRTIWQISNGMRSGSDISIVVKESVHALNDEQMIQIQNYGNKLNPLIMFYMLVSIILPALSITFVTIISSLIGLSEATSMALFAVLFVGVILVQISFVGVIRSLRPSLL